MASSLLDIWIVLCDISYLCLLPIPIFLKMAWHHSWALCCHSPRFYHAITVRPILLHQMSAKFSWSHLLTTPVHSTHYHPFTKNQIFYIDNTFFSFSFFILSAYIMDNHAFLTTKYFFVYIEIHLDADFFCMISKNIASQGDAPIK